jgi:hypothetical protein
MLHLLLVVTNNESGLANGNRSTELMTWEGSSLLVFIQGEKAASMDKIIGSWIGRESFTPDMEL